jgi:hypothetical protein
MAKTDITRQKIKSKLSAIKKINDNPKSFIDNTFDAYKDDLSSVDGIIKKNAADFTSKIKGRAQNKKDIFNEILTTVDGFLGADKEDPINPKKKPLVISKVTRYAKDSAYKVIQSSKQIIIDETKKVFFSGQGTCDPNTTINITETTLSPKEFDFINVLKIDPESISGKLMYENVIDLGQGIKFNRKLYENFDLATPPYDFNANDGNRLFSLTWNQGEQKYEITNLSSTTKISDFLDSYYSTIEYPNVEDVLKNAMLMSLQGDGTESISFIDGMNNLNRLTTKLFSICGNPSTGESPLLNNATDQLNEDETDIQNYFDFDDIEGIDLDDEDSRKRRVLKFRDCDNFEIPINSNHIEDFTYLLGKKNIDENIINTLNKAASDAYEQSGNSLYFDGFQLSLTGSYVLKIPKAIISSIMSPKMIFPIALSYKIINESPLTYVKELIKKLFNLFYNIITKLFWNFIKEFWSFVKRDLLYFVKNTAKTILLNKVKKIKLIVLSLINLITKASQTGIQSCTEIFNTILNIIQAALNKSVKIPVPGLLLVLSERLPGFSADRAYMEAIERLESSGVNMGPIYGTENKFPSIVKGIIDSYSNEMDSNSFIKVALKPTIIPVGPGGAVISPLIEGVGKLF